MNGRKIARGSNAKGNYHATSAQGELGRRDERHNKIITIGICAMEKKVLASPMHSILSRFQLQDHQLQEHIKVVYFSDDVILNKPIEEWPQCNCLIAFYSKGFPLDKAIAYVNLRHPFVINDLEMQYSLMDRCKVYEILTHHGVEVPRYAVLNRKDGDDTSGVNFSEVDDTVEVGGVVFHKPFVEKPVSAEDHNVYIYFPSDYGGGSQRLFRKSMDHSSQYSRESNVRNTGSYIYEEFMATDGADVKVYTVGVDYAHAEARKSPALDGRVERDDLGKEKRFPVLLTAAEKLIARKVVLAFKQTVCGFDLLRANGKSYVCDVNGFSFVKNSQKYYDDCAQILLEMITARLAPEYIPRLPSSAQSTAVDTPTPLSTTGGSMQELRCVIGIIRHGDRTPKQKMKMVVTHRKFFKLFEELNGFKNGRLKLKRPKLLQKVLDIARYLLEEVEKNRGFPLIEEKVHKLQQLKAVLEMYGYFSGINRKVQFRLLLRRPGDRRPQLLLILKWGGELTSVGQRQAEELGRAFRCMYPGGEGEYASLPGSGFLRLHSTYRHDLKVYASDEGRVQMTAAAFTKGLLELEGNVASVLVHLVKRDQHATAMLDHSATDAGSVKSTVKERLDELLMMPGDITDDLVKELIPTNSISQIKALKAVRNLQRAYEVLYDKIRVLMNDLRVASVCGSKVTLYHEETVDMMINRWGKLEKDFKTPDGKFDISKIPDIYDCAKYDLLHNSQLGLCSLTEIYRSSMYLADIVIPQEYGITVDEKLNIATMICQPFLKKIQADFNRVVSNEVSDIIHRLDPQYVRSSEGVASPDRHIRTRLYFTSESHVHSVVNILKYGGLFEDPEDAVGKEGILKISATPELNYMTQIVFLLYEDTKQSPDSPQRYTVSIRFSPGAKYREKFLSEGSLTNDHRGMSLDQTNKVPMNVFSCTHHNIQPQRSNLSLMERSPFRKASCPVQLTDLQNDYDQMRPMRVYKRTRARRKSFTMGTELARQLVGFRRSRSETRARSESDMSSEDDNDPTPLLHSPQLSPTTSSSSLHDGEPEDTKLEVIEPLAELYSVSLKQMSSMLTRMTSQGIGDVDKICSPPRPAIPTTPNKEKHGTL